jgi:hypothetical protein
MELFDNKPQLSATTARCRPNFERLPGRVHRPNRSWPSQIRQRPMRADLSGCSPPARSGDDIAIVKSMVTDANQPPARS